MANEKMHGEDDARTSRGRRVMARLADLDLMDPAVQPEWYPASRRPGVALRAPWSLHIGFRRA
jgi:hypothetical protein